MNDINIFLNLLTKVSTELPPINKTRHTENEYVDDMIVVCNKTNTLLKLVIAVIPSDLVTGLERGVLIGHIVKIYKLYDTFLFLIASNRLESAIIFTRLILDTFFNLSLFIKNEDKELLNKYKKASLAYDKKLFDEINKSEQAVPTPLGERMLGNIKCSSSNLI